MKLLLTILFLFAACVPMCAQPGQKASIAFWNVENLFDTIPSPFYDDAEFTPSGARRWDTERYTTKLRNLARVIDDMAADIVGLAEVENEQVVRDLVMALGTDYNYIHRSSGDSRGIDLALLYKGDRFFPGDVRLVNSGVKREFLHVGGELLGERVELVVCHMASNMNSYAYRRRNMEALRGMLERMLADDPAARIVVMGDMNAVPGEKVVRRTVGGVRSAFDFMYCPLWDAHRLGKGTYNYRGRWYLYDWMLVSPALARGAGMSVGGAGIFVREYMMAPSGADPSSRIPFRTFAGRIYQAGYSDHLPVWLVVVHSKNKV